MKYVEEETLRHAANRKLSNREKYFLYTYKQICYSWWLGDFDTMHDFLYLMRNFDEDFYFGEENDHLYCCEPRDDFIKAMAVKGEEIRNFYEYGEDEEFEIEYISDDLKRKICGAHEYLADNSITIDS